MAYLTRSDWGSTLPPGGNPITGALAEVLALRPECVVVSVANGPARQAFSCGVGPAISQPKIVARQFVASHTVRLGGVAGERAVAAKAIHSHGHDFEVGRVAARRDLAQVVDGQVGRDRGHKQLPSQAMGVLPNRLEFDGAVAARQARANPKPAAVMGDLDLGSHGFGECVYAVHRITSPEVWSHAPGCSTSAGATSSLHSTAETEL